MKRFALGKLTADHIGLAASIIAVAISLWSTRIAQEAQDQQAEQQRLLQASQVMLFIDRVHTRGSLLDETENPGWENAYVRNYSRLPLPFVNLIVLVSSVNANTDETTPLMTFEYDLGALGPCRQFHVSTLIAEARERAPDLTGRPAEDLKVKPAILFADVFGQGWGRWIYEKVIPWEKIVKDWQTGSIEEGLTFPTVAEPVPDCTPS